MLIYSVYIRRHGFDLDKDVVLVKEGFSWPALALGALWALWHRHWFIAAGLLVIPFVIGDVTGLIGANLLVQATLNVGWAVLVGMMANDIRCALLARAGFVEAGLAVGRNLDEALFEYLSGVNDATTRQGPTNQGVLL